MTVQEGFVSGAMVRFEGWVGKEDGQLHKSGRYGGTRVYPDRDYENVVIPDMAYLCNLVYNVKGGCYHAEIIAEITDQHILDYMSDHPEESARVMAQAGATMAHGVQAAEPAEAAPAVDAPEETTPTCTVDESVYRISHDEIRSDLFTEDRYTVRFSPNGRKVSLYPNRRGKTLCRNGVILIGGMAKRNPFTGETKVGCRMTKERFDLFFDVPASDRPVGRHSLRGGMRPRV